MWDLVPNQGSNPGPLGAQSLSLWTAREVPEVRLYGLHHCHCSMNIDRRYTNTWPWLCSNKTLFIKTGRGSLWPVWFTDPCCNSPDSCPGRSEQPLGLAILPKPWTCSSYPEFPKGLTVHYCRQDNLCFFLKLIYLTVPSLSRSMQDL